MRRPLVAAAVVAATLVLTAFALGGGGGRASAADRLPACATTHGQRALPAALAHFPLPSGSVIDGRETKYGYAIYSGYVPGSINPVRDFLVSRLPAAGYRLGAGDAEAVEAEAAYAGRGVRGRWKVRELYSCPGALSIRIAVR